jgi:hypothetical protein
MAQAIAPTARAWDRRLIGAIGTCAAKRAADRVCALAAMAMAINLMRCEMTTDTLLDLGLISGLVLSLLALAWLVLR